MRGAVYETLREAPPPTVYVPLARFISSLLFGLTPSDAPTLAGAAFVPARRATEVNPVAALRYE